MLSYICYYLLSFFADVAYPTSPLTNLGPVVLIFLAVILFFFIQLVIGGIVVLVVVLNRQKR